MDEHGLIEAARKGNVQAFNTLILHYQEAVYNFSLRIMGDPAAAADATQQAFISAYKALIRYRTGNFKAWLFRIANNKCYDALRVQKRRSQASIDEIIEENESPAFLRDASDSLEAKLEQDEMLTAIQQCLMGLSESQRSAVVLHDMEDYDYKEIATILKISLGTVKSRLNRGRRKLQTCLRQMRELLPHKYR